MPRFSKPFQRKNRLETRQPLQLIFLIPAGLAVLFIALTFLGLLWNIPWSKLFNFVTNDTSLDALQLSLIVSVLAAIIAGILGMPLAVLMNRAEKSNNFRWLQIIIRGLVLLPLVLPPVVGGIALLFAFGRNGLIGQWLYKWFDISLPFTTASAVLASVFVALPFFVLSTETVLQGTKPELEETARAFGARGSGLFFRIIFPQILPGVLSGLLLSFARSLGEFGATITFAGNLSGRTQTLPLAIFESLESGKSNEALAVSLILLLLAAIILVLLHNRWVPALVNSTKR